MANHYSCIQALKAKNLFESSQHESRFADLFDCYSTYPFFTAGLCKCMYLSAWDDEHFMLMLDILNDLTIGRESTTRDMEDNGKLLEDHAEGYEREVMRLSSAFLANEEYFIPEDLTDPTGLRIIGNALRASDVIDEYFARFND